MIFDIQRFSTHDGPGIRTVVFLKGCPLSCAWCENPESQSFRPEFLYSRSRCVGCGTCLAADRGGALAASPDGGISIDRTAPAATELGSVCPALALRIVGRDASVESIMEELLKDRKFFEKSGGGLTVSGGEPLAQLDFAMELLKSARDAGIDTAVESCLAVPRRSVERASGAPRRWLVDLKHVDAEAFRRGTGGDARLVLGNLEYLAGTGADLTIRVPVIPGFNDDGDSMGGILGFAAALPNGGVAPRRLDLLPYHDFAAGKYAGLDRKYAYPPGLRTDAERLNRYADMGRDLGLDISIGG